MGEGPERKCGELVLGSVIRIDFTAKSIELGHLTKVGKGETAIRRGGGSSRQWVVRGPYHS